MLRHGGLLMDILGCGMGKKRGSLEYFPYGMWDF